MLLYLPSQHTVPSALGIKVVSQPQIHPSILCTVMLGRSWQTASPRILVQQRPAEAEWEAGGVEKGFASSHLFAVPVTVPPAEALHLAVALGSKATASPGAASSHLRGACTPGVVLPPQRFELSATGPLP